MIPKLSKLGLGSAQFGLGAPTGPKGRAPEAEAQAILAVAARNGLSVLDTCGVYGRSETLLGGLLPRPMPFRVSIATSRCDRGPDSIETEARASLKRLGLERCDSIVVPNAGDLFSAQGPAMWERLARMKGEGLVKKIGVSVHASDDAIGIARRFKPDIIQAPASLLDQRLLVNGALSEIAGMGIEVQLRSIFLHGLLFLPPDRIPAPLKGASSRLSRVRRLIAEGRSDPLQAALGFALSRPEASVVLVGVTSAAELSAVVAAASSPPPDLDWDDMALDDPAALDGDNWAAA